MNFDKEVQQMQDAELASIVDIYVRYVFFISYGAVVFFASGDWNIASFCAAYLMVNSVYCIALARTRFPVDIGRLIALILLNAASCFALVSLALYLTTFEQTEVRITGFVIILCYAFFNVSRNTSYSAAALVHTASVVVFGLAFLLTEVPQTHDTTAKAILCLAVAVTTIYYLLAQWHTIKMHAAIESANEREVHNEKVKAVGRLTGGVAHDFNNLLTVVKGNLELHSEIADPRERKQLIGEAYQAASRAEGVIKQLLSFTRQSRLAPSEILLADWCKNFSNLTTRLLPASVDLHIGPVDPEARVFADQGQLTSAVLNLVLNARDAVNNAGEIKVQISGIEGPIKTKTGILQGKKFVSVCVSDNGFGITKENLARITDPFFTTKDVGKGSGLGLSMAFGFAEQSGGTLELESEPRKGTRAALVLPAATWAKQHGDKR